MNLAFNDKNSTFNKYNKFQFKKLLELSLLDTYFIFDKQLYKQINGLAMGQPVAPTLANIFLGFHRKKWLNDCPQEFRPVLYKIYIDDTFLLFRSVNTRHECIQFTKEIEINNSLSFLDVIITKK